MISKYQQQAVQSAVGFGGAAVFGLICVGAAFGLKDPPAFFGILLAAGVTAAGAAAVIFYCLGVVSLARAKGYSAAFFTSAFVGPLLAIIMKSFNSESLAVPICMALGPLLPLVIALFMSDVSNPAREQDEAKYTGARCVQCDGRIPAAVKLCPHCGYTQPSAEAAVTPAQTPALTSAA